MNKNYLIKRQLFVLNKENQIKEQYQFIKEVGRGAFGKVFLAKMRVFPHFTRVVKVISKKSLPNPTTVLNEIRIMGKLDHPHIVKLYQTFEDVNNLFLVLDYCSGKELYDRLGTNQTFTQQIAKYIFRQMVVSVRYLHSQKICHRDLKLENFMMENEVSWDIRMIDFGLSFAWNKNMKQEIIAKEEKKLIGTCYYMSPQILIHAYDQRCDIWSLGVILYMMVTGSPPFDGQNPKQISENIKKLNYSLKTPQCERLTHELLDLIFRMLQPEEKRISLDEICAHPWFLGQTQAKQLPLKIECEKLRKFSRFSKLKKIVAAYISSNFSENEMEEMRKVFERIDNNKDGYLNFQQFKQYFQKQKVLFPLEEIKNILIQIDMDNNGLVNYNQFLTSCIDESILSNEEYLKFAFDSFDLNRDCKIDKEEFNLILRTYRTEFKCNMQLVEELIAENDRDKDGVIDFQEFASSIKYIKRLDQKCRQNDEEQQ